MTNINKGSQYIDSRNLNVRIKLHEMFSTNKQGFHEWIFSQLNLKENIKVLEDVYKRQVYAFTNENIGRM